MATQLLLVVPQRTVSSHFLVVCFADLHLHTYGSLVSIMLEDLSMDKYRLESTGCTLLDDRVCQDFGVEHGIHFEHRA
jgi:hypothetical protein